MKPKVIVNPAAGRGTGGRLWPRIRQHLDDILDGYDLSITARAGDEIEMARQALAEGSQHFIAIGGDGTINGVLNALVADGAMRNPNLRLSAVPAGTANELARAIGCHGDIEGAVRGIAGGRERRFDLLQADCGGLKGGSNHRYAVLAVSWGGAAEIVHRINESRILKRLGGRFSYYVNTLIVTLTYPNHTADLSIDGRRIDGLAHYSGLICNMEVLGGGMRLAPGADHTDGIADLLLFKDIPRRDILLQKPSWLFEGHHIEHDKVELIRGREFDVQGPAAALVDADGETVGRLPLAVRTLKQALPVVG
ncbi:MAG: diacylglycerol kinase family lipid kinase [Alphaproteobacteria bacterium]|nr:diacylglycerol kinase family lipid kinase [Alphaproteobacteria bacterium]MDP6567507.1 diacylglycerol kinase family lipid kinase [Alphaproteobacteria bacterium]MDP6813332.1 diacylglycerol kinase family lipid kinase [Alphaproteobacteria bacterium]